MQYFGQWKLLNSWEKCKRNKSSQIDHKAKQWKAENYSLTSGVCSALGLLRKPILHILILTRGVLGMALIGAEGKLGIDYLRMFDYYFMVCWDNWSMAEGFSKGLSDPLSLQCQRVIDLNILKLTDLTLVPRTNYIFAWKWKHDYCSYPQSPLYYPGTHSSQECKLDLWTPPTSWTSPSL